MATEFAPWLGAFETVRVIDGVPLFLREHEAELLRAAAALGLGKYRMPDRAVLTKQSGRWRWLLTPEGLKTFFTEEAAPSTDRIKLTVSAVRVGSQNWDARFKTVSYLSHVQAGREAGEGVEAILLNENREVAGASRANVFWRREGRLFTPAHEAGCRRGVVRNFILACGYVESGRFPAQDLIQADEIFLSNSMRGIVSVGAIGTRVLKDFSSAEKLRSAYEDEVKRQLAAGGSK